MFHVVRFLFFVSKKKVFSFNVNKILHLKVFLSFIFLTRELSLYSDNERRIGSEIKHFEVHDFLGERRIGSEMKHFEVHDFLGELPVSQNCHEIEYFQSIFNFRN